MTKREALEIKMQTWVMVGSAAVPRMPYCNRMWGRSS